ncbi:hypothetical protein QQX98_000298 [Neonectria punicea]|uniref:Uncharacterized protein n=1 Tax=Neonectria punicea TaxID=979145 RepID=A0ABR1HU23_9HYPO
MRITLTADSSGDSIVIPECLSRETLNRLGFDDNAADLIWSRWINRGLDKGREVDGGPVTFLNISEAYVNGAGEDTTSDDDTAWYASMATIGINEDLQAAIMTPQCRDVRLTESCKYWILDTVLARYASLEKIEGVHATTPGHTVLYRGMFQTNLRFMFNEEGEIVSLAGLFNGPSGDFSPRGYASHMVVDFEVANKYAYFAKLRDPNQLAVIVRLEMPNSALEIMDDTEKFPAYWPSQGRKHLVWNCRREYRLRNEWTRFLKATLVIGTICGKPDKVIQNLQSADDITHDMVLQGPRGDAIQFAFIGAQGEKYMSSSLTVHPMIL